MNDCIIIGGGPAGLTAALYLARFLRSVTVFDTGDGRARMIPKSHNLTGFPDGISGVELLDRMRAHAERYGAVIETEKVSVVEKRGEAFHVTTDRRVETSRNVIFASGVSNHRPPLSVHDHDRGLSLGLIRYCPVCDAYEVRDKRIAVLGSGAHGFAEASFIRGYSSTVMLIPPDGVPGIAKDGIGVLDSSMKELSLSDTDVIVALENGEKRHFDTLYVALGTTARSDLADKLGVHLGEDGCIIGDTKRRTNVAGVYAIGDITDGLDQIAHAIGQAAVAATEIHNILGSVAVPEPRITAP